jgi:hypothetical protein
LLRRVQSYSEVTSGAAPVCSTAHSSSQGNFL